MGPGMEPAYGCLKNVFRQAVAGDAQQTGFVDRGLQRLKLAVYKRRWKEMRGAASRHAGFRSEEHTSELQSLMRISYAVFCLNNKQDKSHSRDPLPIHYVLCLIQIYHANSIPPTMDTTH